MRNWQRKENMNRKAVNVFIVTKFDIVETFRYTTSSNTQKYKSEV